MVHPKSFRVVSEWMSTLNEVLVFWFLFLFGLQAIPIFSAGSYLRLFTIVSDFKATIPSFAYYFQFRFQNQYGRS